MALAAVLGGALDENGPSLVVPIDYRESQLLTERLGNNAFPI